MMLFARAGKCGARTVEPAPAGAAASASDSANSRSLRSAVSAVAPTPNPACRKKCRRVTARRTDSQSLMALLLRHRLVEAQEDVRGHGPGRAFRRVVSRGVPGNRAR